MPIIYKFNITEPKTHLIQVKMQIPLSKDLSKIRAYLPSKNSDIIRFSATQEKGRILPHHIDDSSEFTIDLEKGQTSLHIEYSVLGNIIRPGYSWVMTDFSHLNHEQVFMAIEGMENQECEVFFEFYQGWSKLNCGLEDISNKRDVFHYKAQNFAEVIRSTTEIGCYESDGLMLQKTPHHLLFQGPFMEMESNLKQKAQEIFSLLSSYCESFSYPKVKIFSFLNETFQGSYVYQETVMLFQKSLSFRQVEGVNIWAKILSKAAVDLILKNQMGEQSKSWWSLGLRDYLGNKLAFQLGFITEEKYLNKIQMVIESYQSNSGKKFQSLEEASQSPGKDRNYYLDVKAKAQLYCLLADILLYENNSNLFEVLNKNNPEEFLKKKLPQKDFEAFELLYSTCEEINLNTYLSKVGLELLSNDVKKLNTGLKLKVQENRVYINHVELDSEAFKAGLCVGDEILAIDGIRLLAKDLKYFENLGSCQRLLISRFGNISQIDFYVKSSIAGSKLFYKQKGDFIQAKA
ncbi:MAG: hypothetical protein ACO20H_07895 [Bacteriovoracaceae bacterium]